MEKGVFNSLNNIDLVALVIVTGSQAESLLEALNTHGFHFTIINSTGGLFLQPEQCLLIGLDHKQLDALLDLLRGHCKAYVKYIPARIGLQEAGLSAAMIEAEVGGAVVFTIPVEQIIRVS